MNVVEIQGCCLKMPYSTALGLLLFVWVVLLAQYFVSVVVGDPLHKQADKNGHFHHFSSNSRKSRVSGQFHAKISPEMKQIDVFYV